MNHRISPFFVLLAVPLVTIFGQNQNAPVVSTVLSNHHDTLLIADSINLSPVVVTATKRELRSNWISDDHSVIQVHGARIAESRTAAELIGGTIPAFTSDYGGGSAKKLSLRGAGSERTLVLVDGKRTGTNENDLSDIPVSMIDKIEVVEGGQSALYGMDAIGGVVNIITKRPVTEGISGAYSSMVGSYEESGDGKTGLTTNTHQAALSVKNGPLEGFVSGDVGFSDGRFKYAAADNQYQPRDSNAFRDMHLFARVGQTFDNLSVNASGSIGDRRIQNPGSISYFSPGTSRKRLSSAGIDASWHASDLMVIRMNSLFGGENIRFVNNDPMMPQNSRHQRLYGDMELVQEFTFKKQMVTTGIQYRNQNLESNEIGTHDANEIAAFAGGVGTLSAGALTVKSTPALRFDYSDLFGGSLNGKIGAIAGLAIAGEPAVFANFGTASRSPSFNDLFWPKDLFGVGNPDLLPERSMNVDAGFQARYHTDKIVASGRITGYFMNMWDMILWQPDPSDPLGMRWMPTNVDTAKIRGIHGSARISFADFYITTLGINWNDARDAVTKKVLIYRPEYALTYTTTLSLDPFFTGITCRYMSEVFTDASNTLQLPQSTVFDINVGMQLFKTTGGRTAIGLCYDLCNLTNELRATNQGYPLPGREHRLSVKVSF
jgi:vitamin B12 transporter